MGFSLHPLLCMIQLCASLWIMKWRYEVRNIHVLDTARLYSDACVNRSQGQRDWENACWEIVEDTK
jgi:hypothetical protein